MDDVSPFERNRIENFSFMFRMRTGEPEPPKQEFTDVDECPKCLGSGTIKHTRRIRHQHPADEWTIPSLLPLSVNGSFT
jgi:hypothetical protein